MKSHSHDRLDLALHAFKEGVWDWSVGKQTIYYSDQALKILGYDKNSAPNILTQAKDFVHQDELENFQLSLNSAYAPGSDDILAVDVRYQHPDHSWHWLRIQGVVLRDHTGQGLRMAGSLIDITQHKNTGTDIEEDRHRLHELLENIPVNVYYKDKKSQFVLSNSSTAELLGAASADELIGMTDHDFFDTSHANIARENEVEIMESLIPQMNIIERETREDADDTWSETSKMPWLDSKGNMKGIFGTSSDITQIVRTQHELARVAKKLHSQNQTIEEELKLAHEIQQVFLPNNLDDYALIGKQHEVSFSSRYVPATEMAGDFFEIIPISSENIGVLVCDLTEHGARSSLMASMIRGLMKKERAEAIHPEKFISRINEGLISMLKRHNITFLAKAIYCVINLEKNILQYTSAGLPAPILVSDGKSRQLSHDLDKTSEPALGLTTDAPYTTETIPLENINRLLLFTNGLHEVANDMGEYLNIAKINSMMEKTYDMDLDMSLGFLIAQARLHSCYGEFENDICLLGIEIN